MIISTRYSDSENLDISFCDQPSEESLDLDIRFSDQPSEEYLDSERLMQDLVALTAALQELLAKSGGAAVEDDPIVCWQCHLPGHQARDCSMSHGLPGTQVEHDFCNEDPFVYVENTFDYVENPFDYVGDLFDAMNKLLMT